jgi:AAT family amino acid transporter
MDAHALKPRWGQPLTGIICFIVITVIAWIVWYIFSDLRGPFHYFPYPFLMYIGIMIIVGLWQHVSFGNWPFLGLPRPLRGIVMTVVNLVLVWLLIHVVFYKILGAGFNFLSQPNLEALAAAGKTTMPAGSGQTLTYTALVNPEFRFAERAVICFVLIGFFTYGLSAVLFAKWPVYPSNLQQPQAGLCELGWLTMVTLFFYTVLIVPFWGLIFGVVFGKSYAINTPWWGGIAGTTHLSWVVGFWQWMIVVQYLTVQVWRGKPWTAIKLSQPWKGLISFISVVIISYVLAVICTKIVPLWLNMNEIIKGLPPTEAGNPTRFLWQHTSEIAAFALLWGIVWTNFFDDMVPMADKDSWGAFWFRTIGIFVLTALAYVFYYVINWGYWGLGNEHMAGSMAERALKGESIVWSVWWLIPFLWAVWFFEKWPFYVHADH